MSLIFWARLNGFRSAIYIKKVTLDLGDTDIYNRNGLNNSMIEWDFHFELLEQLRYGSIKVFCVRLQRRQTE